MTNELTKRKNNITEKLLAETTQRVADGQLVLPADYSPENALASAWLALLDVRDTNKKPALDVCTEVSIARALRSMLYQGLNFDKKQGYFIVHGNELTLRRSYLGSIMLVKRLDPTIKDVIAQVVYKDEIPEIELRDGYEVLVSHKRHPFAQHNVSDIVGAYCNIIYKDGRSRVVTMTIDEIHRCWAIGKAQTNSPAHRNTPEEMIKRTVINRTCKPIINTSTDATLLGRTIREAEMDEERAAVQTRAAERTNVIDVDFDTVPEQESAQHTEPAQSAPQEPAMPEVPTLEIPASDMETVEDVEPEPVAAGGPGF